MKFDLIFDGETIKGAVAAEGGGKRLSARIRSSRPWWQVRLTFWSARREIRGDTDESTGRCGPALRASGAGLQRRCCGANKVVHRASVAGAFEPLTLSLCHSIAMAGKTSVQREASAGGLLFRSGIKRHNRTTGRQSHGPDYREAACKETAVTSYPLSAGIAVFQEHQRFQFPGLAEEAGPLLL